MGRQHEAAEQLEAAAGALVVFVRECPEPTWSAVATPEGWTVAALAHHCVHANDFSLGWLCQMLAGRPLRETPESHARLNAQEARRFSAVAKGEVIARLERTAERTARFLRALTDAELGQTAIHGVAERELTVGQVIPSFEQHMREHLASLKSNLVARTTVP